jgi:hypothetical protein
MYVYVWRNVVAILVFNLRVYVCMYVFMYVICICVNEGCVGFLFCRYG